MFSVIKQPISKIYLEGHGCPQDILVHDSPSREGYQGDMTLKDECKETEEKAWLTPEQAVNENASIVFNLGCFSKLHKLYMKNTPKSLGGCNNFTVYIGDTGKGPWKTLISGQLTQSASEGCSTRLETFRIDL